MAARRARGEHAVDPRALTASINSPRRGVSEYLFEHNIRNARQFGLPALRAMTGKHLPCCRFGLAKIEGARVATGAAASHAADDDPARAALQ
jgi:hypothetical protein